MSKSEEIKALQAIKKIAETEDSYIGQFFTPQIIDIMISNINSDFPIETISGVILQESVTHILEKKDELIDGLKTQNSMQKESFDREFKHYKAGVENWKSDLLKDLIEAGHINLSEKHFSKVEIVTQKLVHFPERLNVGEKTLILTAIQ
ncbi:MAG: hypothetical protein K0B15_07360 [Lentimicrobium sp.]|nr:hypothetical protein [Lentimicrobium sp.]